MKTLRRYLLICMREELALPEILDMVTKNGGHSKILDYSTHSISIVNTDMLFNKLSAYLTKGLMNEHYFLIQLKSNTNVMGSIPLVYAKQLFREDGMDDIIFFHESPMFTDPSEFNNKLKDAIKSLENNLEHSTYLDTDFSLPSLEEFSLPTLSIDDILDKINDHGMESLTATEIEFLNKQSKV